MPENKKATWDTILNYILSIMMLVTFALGGIAYGKYQAYKENEDARFYMMEEYNDLQLESLEDYYQLSISSLRQMYELRVQLAEARGDISQADIAIYNEIADSFGTLENFTEFLTRYESYLRTHTFVTIDYYYTNIWGGN